MTVAGLWRHSGLYAGGVLVAAGIALAALAPLLAPADPTATDLAARLQPPTMANPFGTDHLGRDVASRLLFGARTTLATAGCLLLAVSTIAIVAGLVAGYFGGWADTTVMGAADVVLAFPGIVLAVFVAGLLGPGLLNLVLAMTITWWAGYARLVRGLVLAARRHEYVEAARAMGASHAHIVARHIWLAIREQVLVIATLDLGAMVVALSGLGFLGLGAQPPTPEWGAMLNDGRPFLQTAPYLVVLPAACLCLTVLGWNLLGDGLRDLLDPRG